MRKPSWVPFFIIAPLCVLFCYSVSAQNPPAPVVAGSASYAQATAGVVSPATGIPADLATISVPPGSWDLQCSFLGAGSGGVSVTDFWISLNTVSVTPVNTVGQAFRMRGTTFTDPVWGGTTPLFRVTNTVATPYFCTVQTTYSVAAWQPQGVLSYRRASQ